MWNFGSFVVSTALLLCLLSQCEGDRDASQFRGKIIYFQLYNCARARSPSISLNKDTVGNWEMHWYEEEVTYDQAVQKCKKMGDVFNGIKEVGWRLVEFPTKQDRIDVSIS